MKNQLDALRDMTTVVADTGDVDAIKKSEILFLEGYLWDEGEPRKAFDKAIKSAL